jgi:hypothetical protein
MAVPARKELNLKARAEAKLDFISPTKNYSIENLLGESIFDYRFSQLNHRLVMNCVMLISRLSINLCLTQFFIDVLFWPYLFFKC